jgi:hypothetical protein
MLILHTNAAVVVGTVPKLVLPPLYPNAVAAPDEEVTVDPELIWVD